MKTSARIDRSISRAILLGWPLPSALRLFSLISTLGRTRDGGSLLVSNSLGLRISPCQSPESRKMVSLIPGSPSRQLFSTQVARPKRHWNPTYFRYFTYSHRCARKRTKAAPEAPQAALSKSSGTTTSLSTPFPSQQPDDMLDFVDQYDDIPLEEHFEFIQDPFMQGYARPDGPHLSVSDRKDDVMRQTYDPRQRLDPEEAYAVENLRVAVHTKLRQPLQVDLDKIYTLYQDIPEPRMSYLPAELRHELLKTLGMTEKKDKNMKSMLRYFSVIEDIKSLGLPLTVHEWNVAMSFATRYVGTTTEVETKAALQLWREMELEAGIKADHATFNILFDAASKAGNFTLAELIYEEMLNRGHWFDRYHHVSLIHFFGLKQNGSAVRAAYRNMVACGEIIDTVTLNCVISSLLRCGEEESAERVYKKMKYSNKAGRPIPELNYTLQKSITKVLIMLAKVAKEHPDMHSKFQDAALLTPDLQTYRILINWYGVKLGNLSKVAQFLDDMKHFRVPLHGSIFLALFKSFNSHSGSFSDWTMQRLDNVWHAFLDALDAGTEGLDISVWMAMAILDAYAKYLTRNQLLDIYEALRARWTLDEVGVQFMLEYLNKLLRN